MSLCAHTSASVIVSPRVPAVRCRSWRSPGLGQTRWVCIEDGGPSPQGNYSFLPAHLHSRAPPGQGGSGPRGAEAEPGAGSSLPGSLRLCARPNPSAAGARRPGERRVSSPPQAGNQGLPSPHPHALLGPTVGPSSHKWNLLRTVVCFCPVVSLSLSIDSLAQERKTTSPLATNPRDNGSPFLGLNFPTPTRRELTFLPLPLYS